MRRTILTLLALSALAATPAHARTLHQVKHQIRAAYMTSAPDPELSVKVDTCRRANGVLRCRVVHQPARGCYLSERWDLEPAGPIIAPAPGFRAWGQCPTVTITPTAGDPSYLPPSP